MEKQDRPNPTNREKLQTKTLGLILKAQIELELVMQKLLAVI
jgi:hypothetical protein